jgi:glycosyltransferase involved in cell wall biosynthesis
LAIARQELEKLADVSIVSVPQAQSRARFIADHGRSFLTRTVFTHYRHDHPEFGRLLDRSLHQTDYAIIHVDSLDLASYLNMLPLKRVVLTHHNIESQLLRDRARTERSRILRAYVLQQAELQEGVERSWCPRVRLNVAVSDRDAEELKRVAPGSETVTVPNGVDIESIRPNYDGDDGLACVGGLGWFPNRDALEYLCEEILPIVRESGFEGTRVRWVGRATPDLMALYALRGVELKGYVDDVYPHLARAACYVMPFRVGGGTRLKLLEAMAAGKAIVTTRVGCMGVDVTHNREVLIADSASEFAMYVGRVLQDKGLRDRLGQSARQLAERAYSWDRIGDSLIKAYRRIQ